MLTEEEISDLDQQKEMVLIPMDLATGELRSALAEATRCCNAHMLQQLVEAIFWADSVHEALIAGQGWMEDGPWDPREGDENTNGS